MSFTTVKAKLLLVDDNLDTLNLLKYSFSSAGYEVATALNAVESLRQARQFRPDLIVLDIVLPDMDGFKICELLHAQPQTSATPIVMLSCHSGFAVMARGIEAGVMGCLSKSIGPKQIIAELAKVLTSNSPAAQRALSLLKPQPKSSGAENRA